MRVAMTVLNDCVNDARVINEAQALQSSGHSVRIIGHSRSDSSSFHQIGEVEIVNVNRPRWIGKMPKTVRKNLRFFEKAFLYVSYFYKALAEIKRFSAETIHCHDLNTLPIGFCSRLFLGKRFIYDSHEFWLDQNPYIKPGIVKKFLVKTTEKLLIRKASAVITVSESIADELAEMYKISRPIVVRNCKFNPIDSQSDLKAKLHLGDSNYLAVYTGLITGGRGLEDFVEVLPQFPTLNLVAVGPSTEPYKSQLIERSIELKVANRLFLVDPVLPNEVPGLIQGADFAFVPARNTCRSYYLSLSNKFFEGVSAGLPLLTSDFPEFKFLVEKYKLGVTYSPEVKNSIVESISNIMDKGRLETYKQNSINAREELNWNSEKLKLFAIYNDFESLAPSAPPQIAVPTQ